MYLQKNFNYLKLKKKISFRTISLFTGINLHTLSLLSHKSEYDATIATIIKLCIFFDLSIHQFIFLDLENRIIQIHKSDADKTILMLQHNIRYLKTIYNLSYKDICNASQINENTLHILLNGNICNTRIRTVIKLAAYFNLSLDLLIFSDLETQKNETIQSI